jgi:hypothetical protein
MLSAFAAGSREDGSGKGDDEMVKAINFGWGRGLRRFTHAICLLACLAVIDGRADEPDAPAASSTRAVVAQVEQHVQPLIDRELGDAQAKTLAELANASRFPAHFKMPVHTKTMNAPWAGLAELEQSGLAVADAAAKDTGEKDAGANGAGAIAALLDGMSAARGKPLARAVLRGRADDAQTA